MAGWAVTQEVVQQLQTMSDRLQQLTDNVQQQIENVEQIFQEYRAGLGAHTADIQGVLESVKQTQEEAGQLTRKLSFRLRKAASVRKQHIENNRYGKGRSGTVATGPSGSVGPSGSGYQPTEYSGTLTFTNPENGQRETVPINRTVYQTDKIDPNLKIPAGTKFANGHTVKTDTTNRELMEKGNAPFVPVKDEKGNIRLVPVELHHLTGEETRKGSEYFTGKPRDGSLVEITTTTHDQYDGVLHWDHPSFRNDGKGGKTRDGAKYNKFREEYWKWRARQFDQT